MNRTKWHEWVNILKSSQRISSVAKSTLNAKTAWREFRYFSRAARSNLMLQWPVVLARSFSDVFSDALDFGIQVRVPVVADNPES